MNYSKEYRHRRSQKKYAWKMRGVVGDLDELFDYIGILKIVSAVEYI